VKRPQTPNREKPLKAQGQGNVREGEEFPTFKEKTMEGKRGGCSKHSETHYKNFYKGNARKGLEEGWERGLNKKRKQGKNLCDGEI